ncbi:MAG: carbohydrate kinase family protein [Phototrophicaceae bacterium]|jgi:adenosine kinase
MEIIVSGSIAYDYLMRFPGRFVDHLIPEQLHQISVSFLVDEMTKHWGGVAANIAFSMAMLGLKPKLFGTAGKDFDDYRHHLTAVGVDCSTVRQNNALFTASFFANTDLQNNQIASFYTGAMADARHYRIADVYQGLPDLVIISPNDPEAMLQLSDECRERKIRFVADPSQQVPRLNGEELRRCIAGAHLLIVNAYEAEIIYSKTGMTLDSLRQIVHTLIITHGKAGATIYEPGQPPVEVGVFPTDKIIDPTGVGDAFRAGVIRGIVSNWPMTLSCQVGALCAAYVLEQVGTQNHTYTVEAFVQRFRTVFDDNGLLDSLLG